MLLFFVAPYGIHVFITHLRPFESCFQISKIVLLSLRNAQGMLPSSI